MTDLEHKPDPGRADDPAGPETVGPDRPVFVQLDFAWQRHVLPARRRESRRLLLGILLPLLLFSLLALALAWSVNRGIIGRYERQLSEQKAREEEKIRALLAPTAEEKALLAELERLHAARQAHVPVSAKLAALAELLPPGFYLESFDFRDRDLRLQGYAPPGAETLARLARLVADLNRSPGFSNGLTELLLIRADEQDERLNFTLATARRPSDDKK